MDWTKAKTILIAALILTNITLAFFVIIEKRGNQEVHSEVIEETINFLNKRNIYVYTKIPQNLKKMPVLEVEYFDYSIENIDKAMNEKEFKLNRNLSEDEAVKLTKKFLDRNNLMNNNVHLDSIKKEVDGYSIVYKNYYKDILLEECYMSILINNGKIVNFEREWYYPIKPGENKKKTIPATTALMKFAIKKENLNEETVITGIDLVYWLEDNSMFNMENTTLDTALPAWKITYNNDEKKYINAYED